MADGIWQDTPRKHRHAVGKSVAEFGLQEDLAMGDDVTTELEGLLQQWFSHTGV